jgi:TolB-like protein
MLLDMKTPARAGVGLLAAVGLTMVLTLGARDVEAATPTRPTIAVLYFDYEGDNAELIQLRKGFAQMLTSDLAALDGVTVLERARLQEVLDEVALSRTAKFDPATAARVGKLLGASYLILGGYFEIQGRVRFDARLVETETGRILKAAGVTAKSDDVLEAEAQLAEKLQQAIEGAELLPARKTTDARIRERRSPVSLKAVAAYGRAQDALDRKDTGGAKAALQEAVRLSPAFVNATMDLARLAM